jgi:hypothetical protein
MQYSTAHTTLDCPLVPVRLKPELYGLHCHLDTVRSRFQFRHRVRLWRLYTKIADDCFRSRWRRGGISAGEVGISMSTVKISPCLRLKYFHACGSNTVLILYGDHQAHQAQRATSSTAFFCPTITLHTVRVNNFCHDDEMKQRFSSIDVKVGRMARSVYLVFFCWKELTLLYSGHRP